MLLFLEIALAESEREVGPGVNDLPRAWKSQARGYTDAAHSRLCVFSRLFCSSSEQKNTMFHSRFAILLLCSKTAAVYTISPNPINLIITATKTTSVLLSAESQYAFAFLRNVPGISNDSTSLETKPDTLLQKMRARQRSVPIGWWRFIFMKAALVL